MSPGLAGKPIINIFKYVDEREKRLQQVDQLAEFLVL